MNENQSPPVVKENNNNKHNKHHIMMGRMIGLNALHMRAMDAPIPANCREIRSGPNGTSPRQPEKKIGIQIRRPLWVSRRVVIIVLVCSPSCCPPPGARKSTVRAGRTDPNHVRRGGATSVKSVWCPPVHQVARRNGPKCAQGRQRG